MLEIIVPAIEYWDEKNELFVPKTKEQTLRLEHSLVSLSKWESKWHRPFLSTKDKTNEEILDYVKCMTLTQGVKDEVYTRLSHQIPSEYRKWHLNQLLTLIRICNIKNAPPKKQSKKAIASRQAALNAARKKKFNTRG